AAATGGARPLAQVGNARVGDVDAPVGAPDTVALDIPAPASGQPLDLAFALSPRPGAGEAAAPAPLIVVEDLRVASPRGLVLRPSACVLLGAWPLVAGGCLWLLGAAPSRGLGAALLAGAAAAAGAPVVPLELLRLTPALMAVALPGGLAAWLPLAGGRASSPGEGRTRRWLWAAGLAALPATLTCLLLRAVFGATLLDHVPGLLNDAVDYWLEARAFAHAGLHGGYFTID